MCNLLTQKLLLYVDDIGTLKSSLGSKSKDPAKTQMFRCLMSTSAVLKHSLYVCNWCFVESLQTKQLNQGFALTGLFSHLVIELLSGIEKLTSDLLYQPFQEWGLSLICFFNLHLCSSASSKMTCYVCWNFGGQIVVKTVPNVQLCCSAVDRSQDPLSTKPHDKAKLAPSFFNSKSLSGML